MAWVRARLCKLQKGCIRLTSANDKVYQLLAHGRWFSPCTSASSTTKTGRHDIAEILLNRYFNVVTNQGDNFISNRKSIICESITILNRLREKTYVIFIEIYMTEDPFAPQIQKHVLHCLENSYNYWKI
jgi:hypothetical protein